MESWVDNFPDKNDSDKRVNLKKDGDEKIYSGNLFIDDYVFNGECEMPIWLVEIDDSNQLEYFTSFDEWELKE